MSVMMGMRIEVDPERFMQVVREEDERIQAISRRAKEMGALHHMFLAGDGEVMVADEWESEEAFRAFFAAESEGIGMLMQKAGVTSQPEPRFWKPLETSDRF